MLQAECLIEIVPVVASRVGVYHTNVGSTGCLDRQRQGESGEAGQNSSDALLLFGAQTIEPFTAVAPPAQMFFLTALQGTQHHGLVIAQNGAKPGALQQREAGQAIGAPIDEIPHTNQHVTLTRIKAGVGQLLA